ncbi:MAG: hypothetical protein HC849_05605 [Oscillatoriales cyanobacterium RU_3_3]|nr:hypothetical protein [Oscillatoriales cyanobacterium RU_3_3]NJR22058.1 hypothetical protein [Richelia sp. CSU_2_1]
MSWNPLKETREWHCATSEEACLQMEARFKKEGLKLKLVATPKTSDPILKVVCIFDGLDADPHAQRFKPYQDVD